MLARIITGFIISLIGAVITWKSFSVLRIFGRVRWAERHLGLEGGSRLFYQLLGVLVILIGFAIMTNLLGGMITSIVTPLFGTLA